MYVTFAFPSRVPPGRKVSWGGQTVATDASAWCLLVFRETVSSWAMVLANAVIIIIIIVVAARCRKPHSNG